MVVIAALGIVTLILGALGLYVNNLTKERVLEQQTTARDRLAERLLQQVTMPAALRVSSLLPANVELGRCLGLRPGPCTVTSPASQRSFDLVVPLSAGAPVARVAGRVGVPVRYTHRGYRRSCAPSAVCPFEAYAYFWATCPDGASSCARAVKINVRRYLRMAPGVKLANNVRLQSVPPMPAFTDTPTLGAVDVNVSLINAVVGAQCHPGSFLTQIAPGGGIRCECEPGYEQIGTDPVLKIPYCRNRFTACKGREVFLGLDEKSKPVCVVLPESAYNCNTLKVSKNGKANCPLGSKMRAVKTGADCTVVKDVVECPDMQITCCKLK